LWRYKLNEVCDRRTRSKYNRKIKIARGKDKKVVRVVEKMKKTGVKILRGDK